MVTWIGWGLTAFFGLLTIIFYFRSRREKKPQVRVRNVYTYIQSVSKFSPHIKVTHGNQTVEHLMVTNIAFWNAGKETIRDGDISPTEPIRIRAGEDVEILEARVLQLSNERAAIRVSQPFPYYAEINFLYLEKGDGLVVQVIHTGNSASDIHLEGKIIGAKMKHGNKSNVIPILSSHIYRVTLLAVVLASFASLTGYFVEKNLAGVIATGSVLAGSLIAATILDWIARHENAVPPSLDTFDKSD